MPKIPLILLPGTLCDATLFAHQIANLADVADPRVVDVHLQDNLPNVARYVLSQVEGQFAVAGLSYGGVVIFELWRQAPHRIAKIALLNSNPYPATDALRESQARFLQADASQNIRDVAMDFLKNVPLHSDPQQNKRLRDQVIDMSESIGLEGFVNELKSQLVRPSAFPVLPTMTCPVLVLSGRDDQIVPPHVHEMMAEKLPHVTLKLIEACGHLSTIEQPEQVTQAMRAWLLA